MSPVVEAPARVNADADDAPRAGIGWRQPHYRTLLQRVPGLGFLEVHSENFFAEGGATLQVLEAGRAHYPVSLHGVGLALGSAAGLDAWHLDQLARLVERIEPVRVSDHACFARAATVPGGPVWHGSDLLPVGFNTATLALMCRQVQQVQERLRRPILVENLASYLGQEDDELSEPAFFRELQRRTGCQLLLDLNNLVVNAINDAALDPVAAACTWVDELIPGTVGEIHLAGHRQPSRPGQLVIDDHSCAVPDSVWAVYRHALTRFGPVPTLIEWDTDLPAFSTLYAEAEQAARQQAAWHPAALGAAAGVPA